MNHEQLVSDLWGHIDRQNWNALPAFFADAATICWHQTSECFTVPEFVLANSAYPGKWKIALEKLLSVADTVVSVVKVSLEDGDTAFHAVSFFQFADGKITALDEYWGEMDAPPPWRVDMGIGHEIASRKGDGQC